MTRASGPVVLVPDPTAKAQALRRVPLDGKGIFNEKWIQDLIADHPDVIGIESLEPSFGSAVTVGYEFESGAGPIDVLLCNSRGLLTIVETKLWRNAEMRRTVVAQVLDYAKELRHWTFADLDAEVRRTMSRRCNDPRGLWERVSASASITESEFIDRVQRCLYRGEFLLLIVGDGVKEGVEELVSTIQGAPGLLYTLKLVELRCFHLDSEKDWPLVVVPSVIARTTELVRAVVRVEAKSESGIATNVTVEVDTLDIEERVPAAATVHAQDISQWDDASFFAEVLRRKDEGTVAVVRRIQQWATEAGLRLEFTGGREGKLGLYYDVDGVEYRIASVSVIGYSGFGMNELRHTPAFSDSAVRQDVIQRLNQIKGVRIGQERADLNPCVSLRFLADPAGIDQYFQTLRWMLELIRKSHGDKVAAG